MLSSIQFVDKDKAEKVVEEERKARKKEKKKQKKVICFDVSPHLFEIGQHQDALLLSYI